LQRRCPHQVDGALTAGLQFLGRGNCDKARVLFDQVLSMDPSALRAEFGQAECAQRDAEPALALKRYCDVANSQFASSDFKTAAWERAGDIAWQQGTLSQATELYGQAQTATVDEDNLRQLDIKLAGLASPSELERAGVERFFFGAAHKGSFPLYTGSLLGTWVAGASPGLPNYLLGKQYVATSQWELAAAQLRRALEGTLMPRVRREALRSLLLASCASDDTSAATNAWRQLAIDPELTMAQRAGFSAIARRCGASSVN
jgi:tetratricopeptide (TPR) repeat protein